MKYVDFIAVLFCRLDGALVVAVLNDSRPTQKDAQRRNSGICDRQSEENKSKVSTWGVTLQPTFSPVSGCATQKQSFTKRPQGVAAYRIEAGLDSD